MDIQEILSDENSVFYLHGTGRGKGDWVVNSIFETGLRVPGEGGRIDTTTINMGNGHDGLFEEKLELLNNYPHLNSSKVIIIDFPAKYIQGPSRGIIHFYPERVFMYKEVDSQNGDKYIVMPEFVVGVWDSSTQTFTQSERYYKNLSEAEREEVFKKVNENYVTLVKERMDSGVAFMNFTIDDFCEVFKDCPELMPLSEEQFNELVEYSEKLEQERREECNHDDNDDDEGNENDDLESEIF